MGLSASEYLWLVHPDGSHSEAVDLGVVGDDMTIGQGHQPRVAGHRMDPLLNCSCSLAGESLRSCACPHYDYHYVVTLRALYTVSEDVQKGFSLAELATAVRGTDSDSLLVWLEEDSRTGLGIVWAGRRNWDFTSMVWDSARPVA